MHKVILQVDRDALRGISESYGGRLGNATRRRIVSAAMAESRRRRSAGWQIRSLVPQAAAALVVVFLLVAPALVSRQAPDVRTPVRDLEVRAEGSRVVLTWSDGGQPRRVVRATSREELAHLDEAKGVVVNGERWVDNRSDSEEEPIVYYYVE